MGFFYEHDLLQGRGIIKPEPAGELVAHGEQAILEASRRIRDARTKARRESRLQKMREQHTPELPGKQYGVILIDPPWQYDGMTSEDRRIENNYATMPLEAIKELPVPQLAGPDCVMFMWVTAPHLARAFVLFDAWSFTYRTGAVWDKQKMGLGFYFRLRHEHLLVATKGHPPAPAPETRVESIIACPRSAHSLKPKQFHQVIERFYPDVPRLEMFARDVRPGWDAWGNQI